VDYKPFRFILEPNGMELTNALVTQERGGSSLIASEDEQCSSMDVDENLNLNMGKVHRYIQTELDKAKMDTFCIESAIEAFGSDGGNEAKLAAADAVKTQLGSSAPEKEWETTSFFHVKRG